MSAPGRKPQYGRYIAFHEGYFKVLKTINGHPVYIGTFKTPQEAIKLRDALIENNWDFTKIPDELLFVPDDLKNRYIHKFRDEYLILKTINGEKKVYGRFDNIKDAIKYRNWLIVNNWQVEDEVIEEEKIDSFVYLINDEYVVRNEIDGELIVFGKFDDMGEAIQFRNKCVRLNWKLE